MLFLAVVTLSSTAHAYEFEENHFGNPVSWPVPSYTAEVNIVSIGVPSPNNDEIMAGVAAWDRFSGSIFATSTTVTSVLTHKTADNHNAISFATMMDLNSGLLPDLSYLPCVTAGATFIRQNDFDLGNEIVEVDILLDVDCNWEAWAGRNRHYDLYSTARVFFDAIDLDGVVIHEVGHAVGLAHNDGEPDYGGSAFLVDYDGYPTTMEPIIAGGSVLHLLDDPNAVWGNDWWNEVVVNENDREGMRDLYAPLADPEDFAVQAYWHDNLTTVLADQIECKAITGSKGLARPQPSTDLFSILEDFGYAYGTCPSGGWPAGVYVDRPAALPIQPFAIVEPSFTLLSLGDIGGSVEWQIHLKLDVNDEDCSDPGCYVLGTYISTVNSNQPYQREAQEVVIPPVPPGSYYLTAYMDSNDAWAESDETNQSAVWQQKLDVQANTCGCSASGPVSGAPGLALILLGFVRRRTRRETT